METRDVINIALSTDDNYACHTAATIASVLYNASETDELHFYVMGNVSKKTRERLRKLKSIKPFKITFYPVDESKLQFLSQIQISPHVSFATYYKLFMPEFFPHLNKMIWLDSDVIARKSLKDFWNIDIENYYFGAVPDCCFEKHAAELGLPEGVVYINSGTFLMNLKKMREENAIDHMKAYIENNHDRITIADQGIINGAFYDKIKLIEHQWNAYHEYRRHLYGINVYKFEHSEEYKQAFKNPSIVHFVGTDKPWFESTRHPYKMEYWKYLKMTPWKKNYQKYVYEKIKNHFKNHAIYRFFDFLIPKCKKNKQDKIYDIVEMLNNQQNALAQIEAHFAWQGTRWNLLESKAEEMELAESHKIAEMFLETKAKYGDSEPLLYMSQLCLKKFNAPLVNVFLIDSLIASGDILQASSKIKDFAQKYDISLFTKCLRVAKLAEEMGYINSDIEKACYISKKLTQNLNSRKFEELIKDKTIAIVGNGPSELGKHKGKEIDSHDLVIRMNNYNISEEFSNSYGTKVDVWLRGCGADDIKIKKEKFKAIIYGQDLEVFPTLFLEDFYKDLSENDLVICVPNSYRNELEQEHGISFPSTGLALVWMIYKLRNESFDGVDLYGFNFNQKTFDKTATHYFNDRCIDEEIKRSQVHDFEKEAIFMANIYNK